MEWVDQMAVLGFDRTKKVFFQDIDAMAAASLGPIPAL